MAKLIAGDVNGAQDTLEGEPALVFRITGAAILQHALGNEAESDAALAALLQDRTETAAYQIAAIHAYRREIPQSLDWLERANEQRDAGITLILGDPFLDSVRTEPRFQALIEKLGLKPVR